MMKRDLWLITAMSTLFGLLIYVIAFTQTPYVIYKPGTAEDVGPMVHVINPDVADDSVLMLTTVRQMYPNWFMYGVALFNTKWDIYLKEDIYQEGETRSEYSQRQMYVMQSSQSHAIQAAYEAADIPYVLDHNGVIILRTIEGMPAEGVLQAGDRIVGMDGNTITRSEEVLSLVADRKIGDTVHLSYQRDGVLLTTDLVLADYSLLPELSGGGSEQGHRPGLGIYPADLLEVKAEEKHKQVTIEVENIGGPSAGLMFALEIYDQLTPGDLTKGYRIAGTGVITPDGEVGPIGGVKHKVVAANREDADIFFAPENNAKEAMTRAKEINADMEVIPANTIHEALDYLAELPMMK